MFQEGDNLSQDGKNLPEVQKEHKSVKYGKLIANVDDWQPLFDAIIEASKTTGGINGSDGESYSAEDVITKIKLCVKDGLPLKWITRAIGTDLEGLRSKVKEIQLAGKPLPEEESEKRDT